MRESVYVFITSRGINVMTILNICVYTHWRSRENTDLNVQRQYFISRYANAPEQ